MSTLSEGNQPKDLEMVHSSRECVAVNQLADRVTSTDSTLQILLSRLNDLRQDIAELTRAVAATQGQTQSHSTLLANLSSEMILLKSRVDQLDQAVKAAKETARQAKESVSNLESRIDSNFLGVKVAVDGISDKMVGVESNIDKLESSIDKLPKNHNNIIEIARSQKLIVTIVGAIVTVIQAYFAYRAMTGR